MCFYCVLTNTKTFYSFFFISAVLYQIADHALCSKEHIDSHLVKQLWLTASLANSNELHRLNYYAPPIDCRGLNDFSIFQHLENHSSFEIESECDCGTFYHRDFQLEINQLKELDYLGNPNELKHAKMPICRACNDYRVLKDLTPFPQNWLLPIKYTPKNGSPSSPLLAEIPRYIQMGRMVYKLEYASYAQLAQPPHIGHAVSMHLIRHSWYFYDSAITPLFKRWRKPRYDTPNAILDRIVYFRVL